MIWPGFGIYRHIGPGILWCRGQSVLQTVLVIGGAGPFLGHHAGAYGMVGGTEPGEDGAVLREAFPLKDLAAAAGRVGSPFHFGNGEFFSGIKGGKVRFQAHAAFFHDAEAAPFRIARLHEGPDKAAGCGIAFPGYHTGVAVLEEGHALRLPFDDHGKGGKKPGGREAGHNAGNFLCGQLLQWRGSRDGADMAGIKVGIGASRHDAIGLVHGLVGGQEGEIREMEACGALDGKADRRGGGLESHGEEAYLFFWMLPGVGNSVQGSIDHLDFRPFASRRGEASLCAGDADQVAEGADGHLLFPGEPGGFVDEVCGGYADGAARPGDQLDFRGKELADAQTEDFMGMGAADFHDADLFPMISLDDLSEFLDVR